MNGPRRLDKRRRLLAKWGWLSLLGSVAVVGIIMAVSQPADQAVPAAGADMESLTSVLSKSVKPETVPISFADVTDQMGMKFRHFPATRASVLPEDMGSGIAVGDFDGDGFDDVFFVNCAGNAVPGAALDRINGRSRLYRNDAGGRFVDVTGQTGVGFVGYGMGASWGDYDSDGDLDLYVTAFGANALYENNGDGTFVDVTHQAGVQDERFSAGSSWADYDRDGDLDLYVCNYVAFVYREKDRDIAERQYSTEQPYTLNPSAYLPQTNALFRNNGDKTFTEVAKEAGLEDSGGRSLSASWVDLNGDGWADLYVANDVSNNGVYRNKRDGTFADVGAASLAADERGAMGIAAADIDDDGDQDLLVTHWIAQENALYRNMTHDRLLGDSEGGRLWFMDEGDTLGFGQVALDMVGWATGFCDFDNDGRRDLWLVNGSTLERAADHSQLVAQRSFMMWNRGDDGFVDVAGASAPALDSPFVGRGGAQADLDHDGRVDLILGVHGGRPIVLRNESAGSGNFLRIRLRQSGGNTFALGARVAVAAQGRTQVAQMGASSSYLSQDELTLHFGLGDAPIIDSVSIMWPDGKEETHRDIEVNHVLELKHEATYPFHESFGTAPE